MKMIHHVPQLHLKIIKKEKLDKAFSSMKFLITIIICSL